MKTLHCLWYINAYQSLILMYDHCNLVHSKGEYLTEKLYWLMCSAPENIVEFHIGLFATLVATSCLQVILCGIQMVNGLFGCLCGTCMDKGVRKDDENIWKGTMKITTKSLFDLSLTSCNNLSMWGLFFYHLTYCFYLQAIWAPAWCPLLDEWCSCAAYEWKIFLWMVLTFFNIGLLSLVVFYSKLKLRCFVRDLLFRSIGKLLNLLPSLQSNVFFYLHTFKVN